MDKERLMIAIEKIAEVMTAYADENNSLREENRALKEELSGKQNRRYTQLEAAALLGITPAGLAKIRKNGIINTVIVGKRHFYTEKEVEKYKRIYLHE